jgi:hypothetical protein
MTRFPLVLSLSKGELGVARVVRQAHHERRMTK